MKKKLILLFALMAVTAAARAGVPAELLKKEGPVKRDTKKLFEGGESYSYSSDEADSAESLNRVAGEIDLGFAKPEQTFKSSDQKGPIDRQPTSTKY